MDPNFWQNPMFQMGIGLLSGNQGVTGDAAFRNALAGGMGGVLRGQSMVTEMQRRQQATQLAKLREEQARRLIEQQRQMQHAAPQLSAGLLSQDPEVQRQAAAGILSMSPQSLPQLATGLLTRAPVQPPAGLREFAAYRSMTPEQQQSFLDFKRAGSLFAGMADYMAPVGAKAKDWYYPDQPGQTVDPGMSTQQLVAAGAQPRKGETAEKAGKAAMVGVASETLSGIMGELIDPNTGSVDRMLVSTMYGNVPYSKGRMLRSQLEDVLQTKLRLETGAAANEAEVEKIIDRFQPSPLDSDAGIKDKLERLQRFMDLTIDKADPELAATLRSRAREKGIAGTPPPPPGFVRQ